MYTERRSRTVPPPPHWWLAFRVFSLEMIIHCSSLTPPPPSLFLLRFVPYVLSNPHLRPSSFVSITSRPSSNRTRPVLCPVKPSPAVRLHRTATPVWRAGRAESENLGPITLGLQGKLEFPYMVYFFIRKVAPSIDDGKLSSWSHGSSSRKMDPGGPPAENSEDLNKADM